MCLPRVLPSVICTAVVLLASTPAPAMGLATGTTGAHAGGRSAPLPQRGVLQASRPLGSTLPFDHQALWLAAAAMALSARNIAARMR